MQKPFSELGQEMELTTTIKDVFDRVSKKQRLSSSKTQEVIDLVEQEIEQVLSKIQQPPPPNGGETNPKAILAELNAKLKEFGPTNQLDSSQKDLNMALGKYTKVIDKTFITDIAKAYRSVDFDQHTLNQIIAAHFYRQGLFDLGDLFTTEAHEPDLVSLKAPFLEMYAILEAMRLKNLEPALNWARTHRDQLLLKGSSLEMKLHRLAFVEMLQKGGDARAEALAYARTHLAPLARTHMAEVQRLMGCLLWAGRLDASPYAELLSPSQWELLENEVARECCGALGQSCESPLHVAIGAGVQGLPTLLKLANVMAAKRQEWGAMKQLPIAVELGKEYQFHSVFVCPVSREQGSEENPPMIMPCGHVLCRGSIMKLSKSSNRAFKCPYCPMEATVLQCRQLHF
ncbi:hypothetical protein AMTRI_Chr13g122870 [Amborella trichopoda]